MQCFRHVNGRAGYRILGDKHGNAFAQCQVEKVFRAMCFRSPTNATDFLRVNSFTGTFKNGGNLKQVFADVAAYCAGSN